MTRPLALAALLALTACHEPSGRINEGGSRAFPEPPANVLIGTPGDDFLVGADGSDLIEGGAGNDVICGGPCDPALIEKLKERDNG